LDEEEIKEEGGGRAELEKREIERGERECVGDEIKEEGKNK
jgi:hypothetical protein